MKVGIDLGTSYSVIARPEPGGSAVLVPDAGDPELLHTPSVILLSEGSAFVGRLAEDLLETDPERRVIRFFKRDMGKHEPVFFDDLGAAWYPEALSALVLNKLRFDAESHGASDVTGCAITVPAHFNDVQRKAVAAAAMLADLPLSDLIDEPVAAALHYGVSSAAHRQVILAYDFGGGTFDATALSLDENGIYVLAKTGLTELGGKELDEKIGQMILAQFESSLGQAPDLSGRSLLELRRASEAIKIELCTPGSGTLEKPVLLGRDVVQIEISVSDFEKSIDEYLAQTLEVTSQCLKEAGLSRKDIDTVLLVGGSSLVPAIPQRLKYLFSMDHQRVLYHEPSKAVGLGAALRAAQVAGDAERYNLPPELKGVTGYSVGIRTISAQDGGIHIDPLIKKNMPLPATMRKTYYTTSPTQTRMVLDFVQYRVDSGDAIDLGELVVGPLPEPRANYPIEVQVDYEEDGTVQVTATDANSGLALEHSFGGDPSGDIEYLSSQRTQLQATMIRRP